MYIEHPIIGTIFLKPSVRAKNIILRYRDQCFSLTYPDYLSKKKIEGWINENEKQLLDFVQKQQSKQPHALLDEYCNIETYSFKIRINRTDLNNVYTSLSNGILNLSIPMALDISSHEVQSYVKNTILQACRGEGKRLFPEMLRKLAVKYNFSYKDVKINNSRGRWGSCSSQKNINLSLYCMFLPEKLIELIMLHELCHTLEMNHSERFWAHLDRVTGNQCKKLTNELKAFKLPL